MHIAAFSLPDAIAEIEESAFEGNTAMTVVDAKNCQSIGANAFAGCENLSEIHLGKNCTIASDAFADSGTLYVFAPAGGTTESFCSSRPNILFVSIE